MKKTDVLSTIFSVLIVMGLMGMTACDSGGGGGGGSDKSSVTLGVCIGDSITRGLGVATPYPVILSGITGKTFINLGRDGAKASEGISAANSALSRNPSHVLIMYGVNDITQGVDSDTVAGNVIAIADRVAAAGATPVIGEVTPLAGAFERFNSSVIGCNALIRSAAGAKGYAVAATYSAVGSNLQSDGEHPNQEGQNAIASAFDRAF